MRIFRVGSIVVGVLVILVCVQAPAWAATTWQPQADLGAISDPGSSESVASAIDGSGTAYAAWKDDSSRTSRIYFSEHPAGGSWSTPVALTPDADGTDAVTHFALASNDAGALALVWVDDTNLRVQMIWRDAGDSSWSSPQTIDTSATDPNFSGYSAPTFDYRPAVTVDPSGWATAAWIEHWGCDSTSCMFKVMSATHASGAGSATVANPSLPPAWLYSTVGSPYPVPASVAVSSDDLGDALIAWTYIPSAGNAAAGATLSKAHAAFDGSGDAVGKWSGTLGDGGAIPLLDDAGDATVVWSQSKGSVDSAWAQDRAASASSWPTNTSATLLSDGTTNVASIQAGVSPDGHLVVAWTQSDGLGQQWIDGTSRTGSGASWDAPAQLTSTPISGGSGVEIAGVAADDDGRASIVAEKAHGVGTDGWLDDLERATDGTWQLTENWSTDSSQSAADDALSFARNGEGDLVAFWKLLPTTGSAHIYARIADGAGPQIGTPTIPATATTGVAASFSASPIDVMSSVVSVSWNFGDGSGAVVGTSPQHAFASSGTYDVTVTATDSVGNQSTADGQVVVSDATDVTPPPPTTGNNPPTDGGSSGGGGTSNGGGGEQGASPLPSSNASVGTSSIAVTLARLVVKLVKKQAVTTMQAALRAGIPTVMTCNRACTVSGKIVLTASLAKRLGLLGAKAHSKKPVVIGTGHGRLRASGRMRVVVKLSAKARKAIVHRRSVALRIVFTASSSGAKPASVVRTLTLRAKH